MGPALIPQELRFLVMYVFSAQDLPGFSSVGVPSVNAVVQVISFPQQIPFFFNIVCLFNVRSAQLLTYTSYDLSGKMCVENQGNSFCWGRRFCVCCSW